MLNRLMTLSVYAALLSLVFVYSHRTWAETREARIKAHRTFVQNVVQEVCKEMRDPIAVRNCNERAGDFLTKNKNVPCRSVFLNFYKYNLMQKLCSNIVFNESNIPKSTTRQLYLEKLYADCYFNTYLAAFTPKNLRESQRRVLNLEKTSANYWGQIQTVIQDPCMGNTMGTSRYRECWEKKVLPQRIEAAHTESADFPNLFKSWKPISQEDPEAFCGGEKEVMDDLIATVASKRVSPLQPPTGVTITDSPPAAPGALEAQ